MSRLSELFNVNHFIVCQGLNEREILTRSHPLSVNPHVVPFLTNTNVSTLSSRLFSTAFKLLKSEIQLRLRQLVDLNVLSTFFHHADNVLSQRYTGDITIVPQLNISDYIRMLKNPTRDDLKEFVSRGSSLKF